MAPGQTHQHIWLPLPQPSPQEGHGVFAHRRVYAVQPPRVSYQEEPSGQGRRAHSTDTDLALSLLFCSKVLFQAALCTLSPLWGLGAHSWHCHALYHHLSCSGNLRLGLLAGFSCSTHSIMSGSNNCYVETQSRIWKRETWAE